MFFQAFNAEDSRLQTDSERDSYLKFVSFIDFFGGLFFEGVYSMRQVNTVGRLNSILFHFRKEVRS